MSPLRTALVCASLAALGPLSMSLYTPAMPQMVDALKTTPSLIKLTLTIYLMGFSVGQLLVGSLSDVKGRKRTGLLFLVIYLVGTIACLVAHRPDVLLVGRLLQGIGASSGVVLARAVVRDQFDGQEAARLINLTSLMLIGAPAIAPLIGGSTVEMWGWRSVFALMLGLCVAVVTVVALAMRETRPNVGVKLSLRSTSGSYMQLLADRRFVFPAVAVGAVTGGVYTLSALLPFVMLGLFELSPSAYGASMLAQAGSFGAGALFVNRMLKRTSADRLGSMGMVLVGLAAIGFFLLGNGLQASPYTLMMSLAVWAFGNALINPGLIARALEHAGPRAGAASALVGFFQIGSGFIGSLVAGVLFSDSLHAITVLMPVAAAIAICAATAAFRDSGRSEG